MASQQIRQLSAQLATDAGFRSRFRQDPRGTLSDDGYALSGDELSALDAVDWAAMGDEEIVTRVSSAANRGTHQTA
jgi:hypothetical protein